MEEGHSWEHGADLCLLIPIKGQRSRGKCSQGWSWIKMELVCFYFLKTIFREGETLMCEGNINRLPLAHPQLRTWPTSQARALTRNRTSSLLVHRLMLNLLSHTSQGKGEF